MADYQGNSCNTRKHVDAQAFDVYALSKYYRATSSDEAINLAGEIYLL